MTDYIKALNSGFSAAKAAELAREEKKMVIYEASNQLVGASGGSLSLDITDEIRYAAPVENSSNLGEGYRSIGTGSMNSFSSIQKLLGKDRLKIEYKALSIIFKNDTDGKVNLCTWVDSDVGFPIKLQFSGKEITCRDKRSLEAGIVEVLSDPKNGELIFNLLNRLNISLPSSADELNVDWQNDELL